MIHPFLLTVIVTNDCNVSGHDDSLCENGGMCTDQVKGYTCSCVGNYEGANCEISGKLVNVSN